MKSKRNRRRTRIGAGMLAACLCMSSLPGIVAGAEEGNAAMGRYLESEVTLPEGLEVRNMKRLSDGRLRIIGRGEEDGESLSMWDSTDLGETWELAASLPNEYADYYIMDVALSADGGGGGIYMIEPKGNGQEDSSLSGQNADDSSGEYVVAGEDGSSEGDTAAEENGVEAAVAGDDPGVEAAGGAEEEASTPSSWALEAYYLSFDAEGNAQSTRIEGDYGFYFGFSGSGDLAGMTYGGEVDLRSRETGEVITPICSADGNLLGICGEELLVITRTSQVQRYDIATGEPLGRDESLEEALFADGASYERSSSETYPICFAEDGERLYYVTKKGIYSHVPGGNVTEQIVDGSLNSISDPGIGRAALEVADQIFFMLYVDSNGRRGIMKYEYSDEVSSVPQTELKIYSLEESNNIREMAVQFQKEYPDVYVNYQFGMSGEDGVTVSDALRTLNTDILAGNGPDILVLDDMSVQTYAEKGLLTDLSDILEEVEADDGVFSNIAYAYQNGDTVPAVPAAFCIPAIIGNQEYTGRADSLEALMEMAKEPGVLSVNSAVMMPEILYPVCAGSWKKEDGTIDQEKLTEYVSAVSEIYKSYIENASETDLEMLDYFSENVLAIFSYVDYFDGDIAFGVTNMLDGSCKLQMGSVTEMHTYSTIASVNKKMGDCQLELLKGQLSNVFCPYSVLSVLNTSDKTEQACEFVRFALGAQVQNNFQTGYPVNQKAFDEMLYAKEPGVATGESISAYSEDGLDMSLDIYWPAQEEIEKLETLAGQLTVCADTELVQKDAVIEQTRKCMLGEISVEEAVNAIMQTINLYLAE